MEAMPQHGSLGRVRQPARALEIPNVADQKKIARGLTLAPHGLTRTKATAPAPRRESVSGPAAFLILSLLWCSGVVRVSPRCVSVSPRAIFFWSSALPDASQHLLFPLLRGRHQIIAIHPRDGVDRDLLRTRLLAFAIQRAMAELLGIHLRDHAQGAARTLGLTLRHQAEMRDLRRGEERGRGVRTRRDACTAPDARRRIHRGVGVLLRNQDRIRVP